MMKNNKEIPGFPNYSISELGVIYSKNGKILGTRITKFGYIQTWLCEKGKVKFKQVHRLVAEAYIDNPNGFLEVNHKDGNKLNNHVDNLEWADRQKNIDHAWRNDLYKTGQESPNAKITEVQAQDAIRRHADGESYNSIAKSFGVNFGTIRDLVKGKTWKKLHAKRVYST